MKVLLSRPLTLRKDCGFPENYRLLADERRLSYAYGQKYPRLISEYVLRSSLAVELLSSRRGVDAIVTGRYGEMFAVAQGLFPWWSKPHLLLDVEWPHRHGTAWRRWISGLWHRAIARGVWKIQVFCEAEADNYATYYGIPRERFVWLPYCTDVDPELKTAEEDYVFTGGSQQRDYATLLDAVAELPIPLRIAAPHVTLAGLTLPPNVDCLGSVPADTFLHQMARARLVVLSLEDGLMRYPGVITYVTALRMGKCVIVNDPYGARSYIVNGESGILVPAKDARTLAATVRSLWTDDARRRALADRARAHAGKHFSLARYGAELAALLHQIEARNPGTA